MIVWVREKGVLGILGKPNLALFAMRLVGGAEVWFLNADGFSVDKRHLWL